MNKKLAKCHKLQAALFNSCNVNISTSPDVIMVYVNKTINGVRTNGISLFSHDKHFETRIEYLIKHGYKV